MTDNLKGVVVRLAIFLTICALALFATVAVFAQLRFGQSNNTYTAVFSNVSGLRTGNLVREAGVEIGKVKDISVNSDATVRVEFSTDSSVVLTEATQAEVRYDDLIGGRFLALTDGADNPKILRPGNTIPIARTHPALDLDSVTGGFRPLLRALKPDQLNALSGELTAALQGEGPAIGSFLNQAAAITNTLADRDQLIGQVVDNLNAVLATLGGHTDQLDKTVTSLSQLVGALAERKTDISNAVAYTNAATGALADLLAHTRPAIRKAVSETDRVATNALAQREYLENILNTLPDKYRVLNRQAMYGDYFNFYFCDVVLKFNGKGGQPVYAKIAGQSTGRCAPK
ncbi:MAG: MCE family protein [Actinomycetota bacterium]|uniref:MCE family protein n=1 Tax=Mycobacterium lentiflavum TaxID=141349 RepID=A0ABY3URL9_MYCLN|nr:MCE family protein [Mycobacterium lentiflavum]MEE3062426.1 MCE family protein [Actinomycetota bacterium]ULP40348.1 MCE family protein [Mycobacterium lentiflavum]